MKVRASMKVPAAVTLIVASLCYAVVFQPFGWVGMICAAAASVMIFVFGRKDHIAVGLPIISYVSIQLIRQIVKLATGRDYIRATFIDVLFVLFMIVELAFVVLGILKLFGPLKKVKSISFVLVGLLGYMCLYRVAILFILYRGFYWGSLFTSLSGMLFATAYIVLILTQTIASMSTQNQPVPQQMYQQPVYQQPAYQQPVYQQPVAPQQPVYQQPVYQQPVYQQPVAPQQPAYQQSVYQQPVYQQPVVPQQPDQTNGQN